MLIFGLNLTVICSEMSLPIEKLKTYKFTSEQPITLYNIKSPVPLLNQPQEKLQNFNSWLTVPGEYLGWLSHETEKETIKKQEIQLPKFNARKPNREDIFSYAWSTYGKENKSTRIPDLIWTFARINNSALPQFLEKYAIEW
jgi:hypothetical protein